LIGAYAPKEATYIGRLGHFVAPDVVDTIMILRREGTVHESFGYLEEFEKKLFEATGLNRGAPHRFKE